MSSETDLYPPDLEVLTPDARDARNRAMAGTFLVVMGSGLMLERLFSNDLDVLWLAIGLSLIVGWVQAPRFLMFAVGSIMTGFASASFLESLVSFPFSSTIEKFLAAAGFLAVYVRYPMRAKWALIPAAITAAIGVAEAGVEFIGFIPAAITSLMLPLLLIGGGALLLMRHALPSRIVRIGLIVIAVTFVASAASSVDRWDGPNGPDVNFGPPIVFGMHEYTHAIPDLGGRQLVVETDSGSIEVVTGEPGDAVVKARASGAPDRDIEVEEGDDTVRVFLRGHRGPFPAVDRSASWSIVVPADAPVRVETESGLVKLTHNGGDVDVSTDSGRVLAVLFGDSGSLDIQTDEGSVQLGGSPREQPTINADSEDGVIRIDGAMTRNSYSADGSGTRVDVDTEEGEILIVDLDDLAA